MSSGAAGRPALTCTDWRGWSAHRISPLLRRETDRWLRDFHWDQRWSFTQVEAAREAGRLPGLVVAGADGLTHGWTFFLRHGDQFQIGTIVSDSAAATGALLDAAFASPLVRDASIVVFSPDAPGLAPALHSHGLRIEPYDYLVWQQTPPLASAAAECRAVQAADVPAIAALTAEAYRSTTFLRPFVPAGLPDDWHDYIAQLVETRGCGELLSDASVAIDDVTAPGTLSAALLATRLSHDTGHIAQLVVGSQARGGGLARRMLERCLIALHAQGLTRVSLLVARTNTPARNLYTSAGFQPAGTFVTAIR